MKNGTALCGLRRGETWSGIYLSQNHMSMPLCYRFYIDTDKFGKVLFRGNCFDENGKFVSEDNGICMNKDIINKLKGMKLEELPEKGPPLPPEIRPTDMTTYCLSLRYSNGSNYENRADGALRSEMFSDYRKTVFCNQARHGFLSKWLRNRIKTVKMAKKLR